MYAVRQLKKKNSFQKITRLLQHLLLLDIRYLSHKTNAFIIKPFLEQHLKCMYLRLADIFKRDRWYKEESVTLIYLVILLLMFHPELLQKFPSSLDILPLLEITPCSEEYFPCIDASGVLASDFLDSGI